MQDFIIGLYENENFPLYLGIAIFVLVIAFFIVFFLGKKDKKNIEKTQKLQAIKDDAFKEVSTPVAVSAPIQTPSVESQTLQQPVAVPVTEPVASPVVNAPVAEIASPVVQEQPLVEPVVEEPIVSPTPLVSSPSVVEPAEPIVPEIVATPPVVVSNPAPVQETLAPVSQEESFIASPAPVAPEVLVSETPVTNIEEESYRSPQSIEKLEPPVPKFNPEPVIEPYIPEPDLDNFNNLATSIESELNELEKQQEIAKPILENVAEDPINPETIVTPVIEVPVAPEEPVIIPDVPEMVSATPVVSEEPEAVIVPSTSSQPVLMPEEPEKLNVGASKVQENNSPSNNPTKVVTDVFSSVYVPTKKEEPLPIFEDTMAIELPKLKNQ